MADSFETPRVAEPVDADATEQGGPKEVLNGIFLSSRKAQTYDCWDFHCKVDLFYQEIIVIRPTGDKNISKYSLKKN